MNTNRKPHAIFITSTGDSWWSLPTGSEDPTWAPPFFMDRAGTYFDHVGSCWGRQVYRERKATEAST